MDLRDLFEAGLTAAGTRLLTTDELDRLSNYAISRKSTVQTVESYELRDGFQVATQEEFNYWPDDIDLSVESVVLAIERLLSRCAETNAEFGFQVWIRKLNG